MRRCTIWPLLGQLHKLAKFSGWIELYHPATSTLVSEESALLCISKLPALPVDLCHTPAAVWRDCGAAAAADAVAYSTLALCNCNIMRLQHKAETSNSRKQGLLEELVLVL